MIKKIGGLLFFTINGGLKRSLIEQIISLREILTLKNIALFENCYKEFKNLMPELKPLPLVADHSL